MIEGTPSSEHEIPVFIPSRDGDLFGILTCPVRSAVGVGVIVLPGGAPNNTAFGRNGVAVKFARRLGMLGFHVMRFDYHGIGDSDGDVRVFRLKDPFVADLQAIVHWMSGLGLTRFVLVGTCFGARTALASARGVEGLLGLVLSSLPVLDDPGVRRAEDWRMVPYLRRNLRLRKISRLFDPSRRKMFIDLVARRFKVLREGTRTQHQDGSGRASSSVLTQLTEVADRHIPILFMFSRDDPLLRDFREAMKGPLGRVLAGPEQRMTVADDLDPFVHSFAALRAQQQFIETAEDWIVHILPESRPVPRAH